MSVHYNVEETIARMRVQTEERLRELPADAPSEVKVTARNREVTLAFFAMMLSERNRGGSHHDVLFAAANYVAEFLRNYTGQMEPGKAAVAVSLYERCFWDCMNQVFHGNPYTQHRAEVVSEAGGHA